MQRNQSKNDDGVKKDENENSNRDLIFDLNGSTRSPPPSRGRRKKSEELESFMFMESGTNKYSIIRAKSQSVSLAGRHRATKSQAR